MSEKEIPFFDINSSNAQWHLVSYSDRVTGKQLINLLGKIFETDVTYMGSLPIETKSFSREEVIEIQKQIESALANRGSYGIWADDCMIWQPPIDKIKKLSIFEIFGLLEKNIANESNKGRENIEYYMINNPEQIHTYCLDRCWVIMIYTGPGFPPGVVYLVDHYSKKVMGKRYVDISYQMRSLGYSTPHIPMPKYESTKIWETFTANGKNLFCLCGNNLDSDEYLLKYYLYRPENIDGYIDWIAKRTKEKESPSGLIRDALEAQAKTIFQCCKCERFMFINELTGGVMSFVPEKNKFE